VTRGDTSSWSASGPWGIAPYLRPGCGPANAARDPDEGTRPEFGLGRVYWTNWGRIQCCDIGSGRVSDVVRGLVDPTGLVIDRKHNRLFWTDPKAGKVQCSALDGTRVCDVVTGHNAPWGLALGPTHLFWTDRAQGVVYSCCLKSGIVRQVITGLRTPEGIALHNGPRPTRKKGASSRPTATARPPAVRSVQRVSVSNRRPASQPLSPLELVQPMSAAVPLKLRGVRRTKVAANAQQPEDGGSNADASSARPHATPTVQDIMRQSELTLQRLQRTQESSLRMSADESDDIGELSGSL